MVKYTFEHLTDLLPICDEFPINDKLPRGVSYGTVMTEFVPPDVSVEEGDLSNSQVLIVAAPGAVGKSTLGRALSSKNHALIWNLADAEEVGSGSLDAMLEYAMQPGLKSDFVEWMSKGLQFIIIDALDEGRIKVNENSFSRLLENISRLAKDTEGICFVLLGRTQIAELVWLSLTDQDINASILTIDPFSREQANEYIRKRAKSKWTSPYDECRDLIFQRLEAPMKDGPESEAISDFLHYPPVLDVVSVLLNNEPNLMALKNFLEAQTPETSVKLLRDVVNHILVREQREKVVPAFLDRLSTDDQERLSQIEDSLYTSDEQGKRLLASVLSVPIDCTPQNLPNQLGSTYDACVELALTEHPFLRRADRFANPVFESYLYARSIRGDFGEELSSRVTEVLEGSTNLPTTLLAEFYLDADVSGQTGQPQVKAKHVGLLYESLLSSESSRRRVRLSIEGADPSDSVGSDAEHADGEFEILLLERENENVSEPQVKSFTVDIGSDSVISFRRYARDLYLTVPCTIDLGTGAAEFRIGPSVYINANHLRIGSDALVVEKVLPRYGEHADASVILESRSFESPLLTGVPIVYDTGFSVSWPGDETYRWRMYRRDQITSDFNDEMSLKAYLRFRRIATSLRSGRKGALARTKDKIESARIMQGPLDWSLRDKLLADGILYMGDGGKRYFWDAAKANTLLGVSWIDLRKGVCPDRLRHYLSGFIQENPGLR